MLLLRLMPYEFLATARIIHLFCCIRCISLHVSQQSFSRTEWQELQEYQVYQVYHCYKSIRCIRCITVTRVSGVSGVSLFQVCSVFGADTEQIAPFNFGVAEFILTFVVDAVIVGQFGSWMIFVSLTLFLFARRRKGCESSWRLHNAFQISGNWSKLASNIGESKAL